MKMIGGCQCGAVRYEGNGEPQQVLVCHCTDCQTISGSAFAVVVVFDESAFKLTGGQVKTITSEAASGRQKTGAFCPDCGTRIFHKIEWRPGKISIRGGTLDDATELMPTLHLWTSKKHAWVGIPDGVTTYETQPE